MSFRCFKCKGLVHSRDNCSHCHSTQRMMSHKGPSLLDGGEDSLQCQLPLDMISARDVLGMLHKLLPTIAKFLPSKEIAEALDVFHLSPVPPCSLSFGTVPPLLLASVEEGATRIDFLAPVMPVPVSNPLGIVLSPSSVPDPAEDPLLDHQPTGPDLSSTQPLPIYSASDLGDDGVLPISSIVRGNVTVRKPRRSKKHLTRSSDILSSCSDPLFSTVDEGGGFPIFCRIVLL